MVIYFGADHGGFTLKGVLKDFVKGMGYEVFDIGNESRDENDDYPDFAAKVGEAVGADPSVRRGILICRSGSGMAVAANKFRGVRATVGLSPDHVFAGRHDDDMNVLALAGDFVTQEDAQDMVKIFLLTPFDSGTERYVRRVGKITAIEERCMK